MTRVVLIALCSICATVALAGCGERKETRTATSVRPVRVALAPLNAGEAAVFAADVSGEFAAGGLRAELSVSANGAAAIRKVQQAQADLAVGTEPDLLEARGRGTRVVSVAALVQRPFTSLIAPRPSLATAFGFATKPIGTQGLDYQRAFADTMFPPKARVVNLGSNLIPSLVSKKVSAVIAPVGTLPLPAGLGYIPVDRRRVPTYSEYVLVANQDSLARDEDMIRSFIGALARGTRTITAARNAGPVAPFLRGGAAAVTRNLMLPPRGKPYGWHDAANWRRFAAWMRDHKLPQSGAVGAFTNSLLPGQGP
jgi:ABC-type nitrate/sulfonate/bicarbonate transport system substrate-binding protein